MKKIGISIFALLLVLFLVQIPGVNSRTRPYVSGDTINYKGKAYIGTTNSGSFELFRFIDGSIRKELDISSHDRDFPIFHDLVFAEEASRLYVYLVNGRDLLKYDITYPNSLRLTQKVKDNSGDYFFGLGKAGGERIYTIGSNGVKVWNTDLLVVSTYRIELDFNQNLAFNNSGSNIYLVDKESLKVIDAFWRYDIMVDDLYLLEDHNRKPFVDGASGDVFVVDDSSLRKIGPNGETDEFRHISRFGYDVAGSPGSSHVYFSDGVGLVKTRKSDLKPLDWEWTTELGGGNGWAMGLETLDTEAGEKLVVFNGSSILVMSSGLALEDYYLAQENNQVFKPLNMTLSAYRAFGGSLVTVYGSGFAYNEEVEINIENNKFRVFTDPEGNFEKNITIPDLRSRMTDIKATGLISGKTYSIGFEIF